MKHPTLDVQQFLDQHRFSGYQWLILALCFFIVAVDGLDTAAMGFIAPALAAEWGVSKAALAPVMGAALFGLAIGALTAGPLADRYGRRSVIIGSAFIFGMASLVSAASSTLWELTALRFLTGLGLGAAMPNTVTLMTEFAPARKRATLVTLMFCGFSLGSAASGFVAAALIPAFGWRSLLFLGGVLPLATTVLLWIFLPESPSFLVHKAAPASKIRAILRKMAPERDFSQTEFTIPAASKNSMGSSMSALFKSQNTAGTLLLWLTYFMGLVVVYLLTGWLPTLMKESGVPLAQSAVVTSMFMFGSTFGTLLMGWLMDRFSHHLVMGAAYLAAAVCVVLIGLNPTDVGTLRILVFSAGFAMGAQVAMPAVAALFYPTSCRSTGVSWMLGIGRFGGILGASIGGVLMTAGWDFRTIFFALAAPALFAALAIGAKGLYYRRLPARNHGPVVLVDAH